MKPQSTQSYDVDNRYRFYNSLDSRSDISADRRGVRSGVDDNSSKNFGGDVYQEQARARGPPIPERGAGVRERE